MAEEEQIVYSNNNGEFQIENLPNVLSDSIIGSPNSVEEIEKINVVFSKEGFQSKTIPLYSPGGTLRTLGTVELLDNETYLQKEIDKNQGLTKEQVNDLLKDKKDLNWYTQKKLNDIINQLKKRVLPLILTPIIVKFGVSDPSILINQLKDINNSNLTPDILQQQTTDLISNNIQNPDFCPDPNSLKEIISIKNSITLQLNRTMNILDTTTKFVTGLTAFIQTTNVVYQALRISPIPIPPGAPVSLVGAIEDTKEFLNKNIGKFSSITSSTLAILVIVREILVQILEYSNLLDTLIQQCYPESELEDLNTQLRNLSQNQNTSKGTNQILSEVNGFKLEIESEITNKSFKRKRAIAKDPKGVIALKGEYSFSSKEQILLDELSFYIKSNNLKAE